MLPVFKHISSKHYLFYVVLWCALCTSSSLSQYANIDSDSLLVLGNEVYRQGHYSESEAIYREALEKHSFNKKSNEWIIASVGLGASLLDQGDLLLGRKWMLKADSSISNSTPYELQAYVNSNIGWAYKTFQDYQKSKLYYAKALDLAEKSSDKYRIAQVSNSLSLLTLQMGYYDETINYARIAVESFEELQDFFLLSLSYSNLSSAYEALGFTEKAEEYLLRSYNLKIKIQNEDLISASHNLLGSFYHRIGNFDKALVYYSKYLSSVEEVGNVPFIPHAYEFVGRVYFSLGEFEKALEYFNKSNQISKDHNLKGGFENISRIALTYQNLHRYDVARNLFGEALQGFKEKNDTLNLIDTYLKISELNLLTSDFKQANKVATTALSLSLKTQSKQLQARSFAAVGRTHAALDDTQLALSFSRQAFNIASLFKGYRLADYSIDLAKAYHNTENDSAFYYADYAFSEIEREQQSIYGDNLESGVFSNYASFYNEVAYWHLEKDSDIAKAFEITERGRARVLLERLSFSNSDLQNVVDDTTLITLRQQERNIDKLYRKMESLDDERLISQLKDQINDLELQYQSRTNELYLKYPELRSNNESKPIGIQEVQNLLSSKDALIEYMFTESSLVVFWVTKNDLDYFSFETDSLSPEQSASKLISEFRSAIQEKATFDIISQRSQPLFDLLLEPISDKFDGINNLLIVPSKSLSLLPFEALYINSSFLIEKFNIKYLPSSTIYKYIEPPHRTTSRELFAVAGSGLNGSTSQTKNYSSLPSTILEVDAISKEFTDVLTLKDQEVSESKIKNSPLNEFRYLHFATHGNVNQINPQQSGLIISELAESEGAFQEDGYLNSKEISSLTFNADLVVLSACNTAVGKIISGEGLQGLQRSFFKAGASSVIVSLWSVYDRSTSVLMKEFYRNLNKYEESEISLWSRVKIYFDVYEPPMFGYKEKALREAKLFLLDHPYYNHPVNWAPFILIGK